jgi:hypothetical protein
MDANKVAVVRAWPQPHTVRAVWGFLGLTGYYQKIIRSYGDIAAPHTQLLKRNTFCWTSTTTIEFEALKETLTIAPVLQLPDFDKAFIVDCNASGSGISTILHQGEGPLTFFNRAMQLHHAKLATYERELIGLVKAVLGIPIFGHGRSLFIQIISVSSIYLISTYQLFRNTPG